MVRGFFIIIFYFFIAQVFSQTATWYNDVAPIVQNNCVECHRIGGIAPFPLESYNDVINQNWIIPHVLTTGEMPPWPQDTLYRNYAYENMKISRFIN